jgi:putative oxidoreductase
MSSITKISYWADTHHPIWLDVVRVALGSFLFMKGIYFLEHQEMLRAMMPEAVKLTGIIVIVHYVAFAHLVGGIFIAIGLFTRLSVLLQLPVLLGAVFITNMSSNAFGVEWFISFSVLLALGTMLLMGSGKHSADHYLDTHHDR